MANTSKRGFASMAGEKQRLIASKGGKAAHAKGTAHEWSSDEARAAGRKGGESRGSHGLPNDGAARAIASPLHDRALATSFLSNAGRSLRTESTANQAQGAYIAGKAEQNVTYSAYNTPGVEARYAGE